MGEDREARQLEPSRQEMSVSGAREIIAIAIRHGVYVGEQPEGDVVAVKTARSLVGLARWSARENNGGRHRVVREILNAFEREEA